ncbi:MAG: hypothetical protein RL136_2281 [Planctomycetota bacterium]|jgi:hypothetical protein
MQHTHRLSYLAGHMFIDLPEGRFLVDTGSPVSFGDTGTASYGGEGHSIPRDAGGVDLGSISALDLDARIGQRLRGLIGMDLLGRESVLWDGPRGRAIVRPPAPPVEAPSVRIDAGELAVFAAGVPVVEARFGGRPMRFIFDTGAQYGYVTDEDMLALGDDAGPFDDFHPVLGAISSCSTKIRLELVASDDARVRIRERFGFDATLASLVLRPLGVAGIIGCSWLSARQVWFLPSESRMAIA